MSPVQHISRRPGWAWWVWDLGVTAVALLLLLAWDASGADLRVAQMFGTTGGFAWQQHWLTAQVLHGGGRVLSGALLLVMLAHLWRPLPFAPRMQRAERLWWLLATLACLLLIPFVKNRSLVSCPWDLAQFGGAARYLPHSAMQAWVGPGDGGPGRCFPSGHASGAFSFVTGWFVLRGASARVARGWLLGVCALGLVFGVAQVARGAHYPSHVAWTAWLCWAAAASSWHVAQPASRGPARCRTRSSSSPTTASASSRFTSSTGTAARGRTRSIRPSPACWRWWLGPAHGTPLQRRRRP